MPDDTHDAAIDGAPERARRARRLLVLRVVPDGEPRTVEPLLVAPRVRGFVARHVLLVAAAPAEAATATGGRIPAGTLVALRPDGKPLPLVKPQETRLSSAELLAWLWTARALWRAWMSEDPRVARYLALSMERCRTEDDARTAAAMALRRITRGAADPDGILGRHLRRLAAKHGAAREAVQDARAALHALVVEGAADGVDVRAWVALHDVLGDHEGLAHALADLARANAPRPTRECAAEAAHSGFARCGRWSDLLAGYPDPLAYVRARAQFAASLAPGNTRPLAPAPPESYWSHCFDLFGALLIADRPATARRVAALVLGAAGSVANRVGLVEAGIRAGRRRPEFADWLRRAETEATARQAAEIARLRAQLEALPE